MANILNPAELYAGIAPSGNKSIQGWNSHSPVFDNLVNEVRPAVIIEVGTWLGASAIHMARAVKALGLQTKIYCVDTWLGAKEFWIDYKASSAWDLKLKNGYPQVYFDFLANVVEHGMQDVIIPVPNTSYIGSLIFKHYGITPDLVYIDGSHEYQDVKLDIHAYSALVRPGGILFGDDIHWPGVNQAVREVFSNTADVYENNFWIYRKPS